MTCPARREGAEMMARATALRTCIVLGLLVALGPLGAQPTQAAQFAYVANSNSNPGTGSIASEATAAVLDPAARAIGSTGRIR